MDLRDKIKSSVDFRSEIVDVPEWDVTIEVRSMSVNARAQLLQAASGSNGSADFLKLYPALLIACCFDPSSGERLFSSEDEAWLSEKASMPVERLADAAMRISGLSEESVTEGKGGS